MTPWGLKLRLMLRIWMVLLTAATVIFLLHGNGLIDQINNLAPTTIFPFVLLPLPVERFWLALALSLMATLVFLCYWGQKDVRNNHHAVVPFLASKFASTFFYFAFFAAVLPAFAYFVGMIADGLMFLATYFVYRSFLKEIREPA